jgi:regulator of sigma E protease
MHYNKEYVDISNIEEGIYAYEYAETLGFQTGDIITAIDGKDVVRYADVFSTRMFFGDEVTVLRSGNIVNIALPDTLYHFIVKGEGFFFRYDNYPFEMDSVLVGGNAEKAGLQSYDDILTVDGQDVAALGGFREDLFAKRGNSVDLKVNRLGDIMHLTVPVDSIGMIGIALVSYDFPVQPYTFGSSMKYGWKDAFESIRANAKGLGKVFSGKEKVKDSLQGPIGIAKIFGGTWNWRRFWGITGLLSMVLAFMNILPIPALDGGHVLFTLVEMVIGRKMPDRFMEIFQMIGLVIVMGLMIFIIGNDIINLF